jgi:hypothetical protein
LHGAVSVTLFVAHDLASPGAFGGVGRRSSPGLLDVARALLFRLRREVSWCRRGALVTGLVPKHKSWHRHRALQRSRRDPRPSYPQILMPPSASSSFSAVWRSVSSWFLVTLAPKHHTHATCGPSPNVGVTRAARGRHRGVHRQAHLAKVWYRERVEKRRKGNSRAARRLHESR